MGANDSTTAPLHASLADTVYQRVKPARVGELVNQILSGAAVPGEKEHA